MESPPPNLNVGQECADRISALPDHLLLDVLERLDLREAGRAGALSTRWRRLPNHLSRVDLDVDQFQGATPLVMMDAFTGAARALLNGVPPVERGVPPVERGSLKVLILSFYIFFPHLSSIGRLIEDIVSFSRTECLEFCLSPAPSSNAIPLLPEIGRQFMSFSRAYPVAFSWLTRLTLIRHAFGNSDVTDLINACARLRDLTLSCCMMVDTLKIDVPCSGIRQLEFSFLACTQIELISVPKLRQVRCKNWLFKNPPVCFGYVPELRVVQLYSKVKEWQVPFVLSKWLPRSARNLSTLSLDFGYQIIWIQPEHPKQLTAMFRNLTTVFLMGSFTECDLSWTLFILEAAPALQDIADSAEKMNVVWEPSKDLKHLNLKALLIHGCEDEDKVTNYTRLVMERAVGLKRILLCGELPCENCNAIDPESSLKRSQVDEVSRHRIKEQLTHGSSSSVDIIIC